MAAQLSCRGDKSISTAEPSGRRASRLHRRAIQSEDDEADDMADKHEDEEVQEEEVEIGLSQMADAPQSSQPTPLPPRRRGNSKLASPEYPRQQLLVGMVRFRDPSNDGFDQNKSPKGKKMLAKRGRKK